MILMFLRTNLGVFVSRVIWILALLTVGVPFSASAKDKPERHAFIVGINQYTEYPDHKNLTKAVNDAQAVGNILLTRDNFRGDVHTNINLQSFWTEFENYIRKIKKNDVAMFYFSGHGAEIEGKNYLLPSDAPYRQYGLQNFFKGRAIAVNDVIAKVKKKKPSVVILILDACRDNPFIPARYKSAANEGGLVHKPANGVFVMYSAGSGEPSIDRLSDKDKSPYSVYTRHLLPLLKDQELSIREIARKVQDKVYAYAEENQNYQAPAYYDKLFGKDFCFLGCLETTNKIFVDKPKIFSAEFHDNGDIEIRGRNFGSAVGVVRSISGVHSHREPDLTITEWSNERILVRSNTQFNYRRNIRVEVKGGARTAYIP